MHQNYHLVRGTNRYGLIVDPGAANSLIGSQTLNDFYTNVLQPRGLHIKSQKSQATFSGISGTTQSGVCLATFPIGLQGLPEATFTTDVIDGEGRYCPGLLPLCMVRYYRMSLYSDCLPHGDGILVMFPNWAKSNAGKPHFLQCFLTESSHYLLPIDEFDSPNNRQNHLKQALSQYLSTILYEPKHAPRN